MMCGACIISLGIQTFAYFQIMKMCKYYLKEQGVRITMYYANLTSKCAPDS